MIHLPNILSFWKNLGENSKVLLMVSGGVDSMALLETARSSGIKFEVLHLTHDMRSKDDTDTDLFVVSNYCEKHNIRMHHRYNYSETKSETDYRKGRIRIISDMVYSCGFTHVATGHHADDQVETVIMRIMRGCGIEGIRGIHQQNVFKDEFCQFTFIRPLLKNTKEDLIGFCRNRGISWHDDYTNSDNDILRNAIRNKVIPIISEVFPCYSSAISTLAANAEEASEYINAEIAKYVLMHPTMSFDKQELLGRGNYFLRHLLVHIHIKKYGNVGLNKLTRGQVIEFIKVLSSDKTNNKTVEMQGVKYMVNKSRIEVVV